MVNIVNRENLIEEVKNYDVVLFPMGVNNSMNKGFSYEIGLNFPQVKNNENRSNYGDLRKFGTINSIVVDDITFVSCYVHNGGYNKKSECFINYEYLDSCLKEVVNKFNGKKIVSPIIGANLSDGNGDKKKIISIFENRFTECDITLYDFIERDYKLECFRKIAELRENLKNKKITFEEYKEERSNIEWRRRNGIFLERPKEYFYIPKKSKKKIVFSRF